MDFLENFTPAFYDCPVDRANVSTPVHIGRMRGARTQHPRKTGAAGDCRQAIVQGVRTGAEYIEPREEKSLNQRNGCFVTIKQQWQAARLHR